jgi:hypothetical protein
MFNMASDWMLLHGFGYQPTNAMHRAPNTMPPPRPTAPPTRRPQTLTSGLVLPGGEIGVCLAVQAVGRSLLLINVRTGRLNDG